MALTFVEEWFSLFQVPAETDDVKVLPIVAILSFGAAELYAQEVTLPPMVVTGTFELRQGPSVTDLFTQHLLKQAEAKWALEEAAARAPLFNAKFWSYLPQLQNSQVDFPQFFTPSYLTTDYRNAESALRESSKRSIFEER